MKDYQILLTSSSGETVAILKATTYTAWVHLLSLWNEGVLFYGTHWKVERHDLDNLLTKSGLGPIELNELIEDCEPYCRVF